MYRKFDIFLHCSKRLISLLMAEFSNFYEIRIMVLEIMCEGLISEYYLI